MLNKEKIIKDKIIKNLDKIAIYLLARPEEKILIKKTDKFWSDK